MEKRLWPLSLCLLLLPGESGSQWARLGPNLFVGSPICALVVVLSAAVVACASLGALSTGSSVLLTELEAWSVSAVSMDIVASPARVWTPGSLELQPKPAALAV